MRRITVTGLLGGLLLVGGFTSTQAQVTRGAPAFTSSRPAVIQLVARSSEAETPWGVPQAWLERLVRAAGTAEPSAMFRAPAADGGLPSGGLPSIESVEAARSDDRPERLLGLTGRLVPGPLDPWSGRPSVLLQSEASVTTAPASGQGTGLRTLRIEVF